MEQEINVCIKQEIKNREQLGIEGEGHEQAGKIEEEEKGFYGVELSRCVDLCQDYWLTFKLKSEYIPVALIHKAE